MTEDEAKTKWCMQAPPVSNMGYRCAGADCMAWRWNVSMTTGQPYPQWGGYCGLAGKET